MDRGRKRSSPARFRQLSVLGISIVALMFAAWIWMANSPTPRLNNVGDDSPGSTPRAVEAGLVALALLALVGAALSLRQAQRLQQRERDLVDELRDTREHLQALTTSLDCWQWATDASHRVVSIRPPDGADDAQWSAGESRAAAADKPFLWECFHAGITGNRGLRARLDAHSPIDQSGARRIIGKRGAVGPNDARDSAAARRSTADSSTDGVANSDNSGDGSGDDGSNERGWRLRAAPRFDREGRFTGYVGTARETEPDAPRRLQEAPATTLSPDTAQMTADSEAFSYTVSHDLRAPIRVVEGFTKILKEDYGRQLDRVGNDHLDRVLGAAARMNSMIDALLALAQLQATPLVRQPINLSQLAHYIVDDLRRQTPEREVAVHIQPGMQVRGDPTLLRIALENLLGNAWKYTNKRRLAQIWFESEPLENASAFIVRDNGAGFDMRFADRLFGVFQRLHSANDFQGTGVGLASVRRIIKRHEGEIWADSEPDRGARFHFTLPQRITH